MSRWRSWLVSGAFWLLVVAGWWALARANDEPGSLWPSPPEVADTIWESRSALWSHAQATLVEAALGFAGGVVLAVVFSLLSLRFRLLGDNLYRLSLALYSMPLIALAPVLVLWVGVGIWTKVIIALLASFFPVLVNVTQALRATDRRALELMDALGATYLQAFVRIRMPYALPALVASFKVAGPAAIIGAMLAEWVGAERGLGLFILFSMFSFRIPQLWAALIVASLLSLVVYYLFDLLGRALFPWHPSTRKVEVE